MIGLLQRVTQARVEVGGASVGAIGAGLLVLVCAERGDSETEADRLLARVLGYRVFGDAEGKMNLSLREVQGGLLLVPQFTLAADTSKGMRPSFTSAAAPEVGRLWFERLVDLAKKAHRPVEIGRFGAHMHVYLVNDGPVTFWLEAR